MPQSGNLIRDHFLVCQRSTFPALCNGDRAFVENNYDPLPQALLAAEPPFCPAIHVRAPDLGRVKPFPEKAGARFREEAHKLILQPAEDYGNIFLVFDAAPIV
jgi:hypothetical protein